MAEPDKPKSIELTDEQREHAEEVFAWMKKTLGFDPKGNIAQDDWTLIVKLHAMVETALNAALVNQLAAPKVAGVIAKLDTSNTATGKVAFAKALEILDRSSIVFLQKLSELRNFCVHDIRNFEFNIDRYVASLRDDKRNELVKPVMKTVKNEFKKSTSFREALYVGVMQIMMELHIHDLRCETRDLELEIQRRGAELWKKHEESNPKTA
jgi:hypothetical protein